MVKFLAAFLCLILTASSYIRYAPPPNDLPDWTWHYLTGNSDFGVVVSPSVANHWYYVHCQVVDMNAGVGDELYYDDSTNWFISYDESAGACEYMSTRHEPVQFLPIIQIP